MYLEEHKFLHMEVDQHIRTLWLYQNVTITNLSND